jgi:hypothetical protein
MESGRAKLAFGNFSALSNRWIPECNMSLFISMLDMK